MPRPAKIAFVLLFALLLACVQASARPEKVETAHFTFVHNGGARGLASRLSEIAESKRSYVRHLLGMPESVGADEKIEVRIAVDNKEMMSMTGADAKVDDWVAGMTFLGRDLIVMSARGTEIFRAQDTFVHELAHHYLDRLVGDRFVPRWFHEGFAMLVSSEMLGDRMHTVLAATATDSLIPLHRLERSFPDKTAEIHLAYAQSMFFVRFLQKKSGGTGVGALLDDMRAGMPFAAAFRSTWGSAPEVLFSEFKGSFSRIDSMVAFLTSTALVWFLMVGIFVFVYARKKQKSNLKLRQWELEEELQHERIMRVMADYMRLREEGRAPDEEIQ